MCLTLAPFACLHKQQKTLIFTIQKLLPHGCQKSTPCNFPLFTSGPPETRKRCESETHFSGMCRVRLLIPLRSAHTSFLSSSSDLLCRMLPPSCRIRCICSIPWTPRYFPHCITFLRRVNAAMYGTSVMCFTLFMLAVLSWLAFVVSKRRFTKKWKIANGGFRTHTLPTYVCTVKIKVLCALCKHAKGARVTHIFQAHA